MARRVAFILAAVCFGVMAVQAGWPGGIGWWGLFALALGMAI